MYFFFESFYKFNQKDDNMYKVHPKQEGLLHYKINKGFAFKRDY